MKLAFRKMEGAGNDFVVLDAREAPLPLDPARIAALAARRTGIGCDQLIVLEPARDRADVFMRIHNADGGEAGACGNAARCIALLVAGETGRRRVGIETVAGRLEAEVAPGRVAVTMGEPRLDWRDIPLARPADTLHLPLPGDPAAASLGNPHATFFVDDLATTPVHALGPVLETDALFPERANIGFAQIVTPDRIRLRVWERGAGLTAACGSGACAALVNAHRRGLAGRHATIDCDGGTLDVTWPEAGPVRLAGPAVLVFSGTVEL